METKGLCVSINGRGPEITLLSSLGEDGHLTSRVVGRAETFNASFASLFNTDGGFWDPQSPEVEACGCGNNKLPANPELGWDLLLQLEPCRSLGLNGIHPRVLKELMSLQDLSILFQQLEMYRGLCGLEAGKHCLSFQAGQEGRPW